MVTGTLLLLSVFICGSLAFNSTRDWLQWGKDSAHSRLQVPTFAGSLCGAQSALELPTSSAQAVVCEGVHYYVRSNTDLVAHDLFKNTNTWTMSDIVQKTSHSSSALLSGSVHIAIVHDPAKVNHYVLGLYSVSYLNATAAVVFLVNTAGEVVWNVNVSESSEANATGIVVHPDGPVLLSYLTKIDLVKLPFSANNSVDPDGTYDVIWSHDLVYETSAPAVLADGNVVVFETPSLKVLNSNTGATVKAVVVDNANELTFCTSTGIIGLSSPGSGVLVQYPGMTSTTLDMTRPLAVATNGNFVGYQTTSMRILLINEVSHNAVWTSEPLNISGNVAASVDEQGLVYVLGGYGTYTLQALSLANGHVMWRMRHASSDASVASPIIASVEQYSYLMVDTPSSQKIYSPSCETKVGVCTNSFQCACHEGYFGADCSTFCQRNITCSGRGDCSYDGTCMCDSSYFGAKCDLFCKEGTNCMNGTCSNGICNCFTNFFGDQCNCNPNITCNSFGECSKAGKCRCTSEGLFSGFKIHGGDHCLLVTNVGLIAIIIGGTMIVLLILGLSFCCWCSNKKVAADQYSLLHGKNKHH